VQQDNRREAPTSPRHQHAPATAVREAGWRSADVRYMCTATSPRGSSRRRSVPASRSAPTRPATTHGRQAARGSVHARPRVGADVVNVDVLG
jgi:hypothetical protein